MISMAGTFTLKVSQPAGVERRLLARREGLSWIEVCEHLKNIGDDPVIVEAFKEDGETLTRKLYLAPWGRAPSWEDVENRT